MTAVQGVAHHELTDLKKLAGQVAGADIPDLSALDQIATLATDIAGRYREAARHELLDQLAKNAPSVFRDCSTDLPTRLAEASLAELSRLEGLLDQAKTAQDALSRADHELMAARERGDYAAMAPLALEADTQKVALAAASAEFEKQLRPVSAAAKDAAPANIADQPQATATLPEAEGAANAAAEAPWYDNEAPAESEAAEVTPAEFASAPEETASNLVELGAHPGTRGERRRIRDLIRQVRTLPDEAS